MTGKENEIHFANFLNNKQFVELKDNSSKFVKQLYPDIDKIDLIIAERINNNRLKPDVKVSVNDDDTYVSLKIGRGNSIHQESINLFLAYCKEELGLTPEEEKSFLLYIWGDGTTNGSGDVEDRLTESAIKKIYHDDILRIQKFLDKHRRILLERILVYGRLGRIKNIKADYLFHDRIEKGVWCPLDEAVDYLVIKSQEEIFKKKIPSIGPLEMQAYNRGLKTTSKTNKRGSLQFKWASAIQSYIKKINGIYLEKINKCEIQVDKKRFGDNSHGFRNVNDIVSGLDGIRVRNLRGSMLGMINCIFKGVALTDIVHCKKFKSNAKPDISITINDVSKNVSIFMGTGNSGQQENFEEFVDYCKNELGMKKSEEKALRLVFYGDGTLNGTGKVSDRLKNSEIKGVYPQEVIIAQKFIDKHRRVIAQRFLVTGKDETEPSPDYIFYGTVEKGITISYNDVLDYIEAFNGKTKSLLSIGPLSLQMWGRSLSGNKKSESHRKDLQIKFSSLLKHIDKAYQFKKLKTKKSKVDGINAEYEYVMYLNLNRSFDNSQWSILRNKLNIELDDVYAVRVSSQIHSDVLGRTVNPKSDIYLCKIPNMPEGYLEDNNFILEENTLNEDGVIYKFICNSGISCKLASSLKFTYCKMSVSSFEKIFNDKMLAVGALMFINDKDLILNKKIIKDCGFSEIEFYNYFSKILNKTNIDFSKLNRDDYRTIKTYCNNKIYDMIHDNKKIGDIVFKGIGLFPDPYCAKFLFSNGKLKIYEFPEDFTITTGSGRHKGTYTIVVKP